MDIVQFFLAYTLVFGLVIVCVLSSQTVPYFGSVVEVVKTAVNKAVMICVPDVICKLTTKTNSFVFHTRNPSILIVNVSLTLAGNAVYAIDIIPVLCTFKPEEFHVRVWAVLLVSSLVTLYLSCVSDPGRIWTSEDAAIWGLVYQPDGVMYKEGNRCHTCRLVKPARSKHCNLCGYCVHRFDHHCLWTNNCVGGANLRYFLSFLVSLQLMTANGMYGGMVSMDLQARHAGMIDGGMLDVLQGKVPWRDVYVTLETLSLQHPRRMLLVTSLMLLFILIGLLILYHMMLIILNQTTNERYKIAALSQQQPDNKHKQNDSKYQKTRETNAHTNLYGGIRKPINNKMGRNISEKQDFILSHSSSLIHNKHTTQQGLKTDNDKNNNTGVVEEKGVSTLEDLERFYDRGIVLNLKEVFLPWREYLVAKQNGGQKTDNNEDRS